jgi:hypothetical protein
LLGSGAVRVATCLAGVVLVAVPRIALADPMSTSPEQAYDMGQVPQARAVGMGDALNAIGVGTPALYMNPANMAMARVYHLEAFGAYSPEAQRDTFGLSIVDSVINAQHVAGGLGGTWNEMDPDGLHRIWTDVRAAVAFPLGDYVALGVAGRYLHVDQHTAVGPLGPSTASDGTSSGAVFNQLTFDVGATVALGDFRIGAVGHNLTNPSTALAPTTAALGLGYASGIFALEADGLLDFTTWGSTTERVMGGGELFLGGHYALRLGWRYDTGTTLNSPSLGVGYIDPRWSVELSGRRDITSSHAATLGVLSLKYFYDAAGTSSHIDEPDAL